MESVWNSVQGNVVAPSAAADPTSMLNNQLASALSTMGDAQYWEESISPTTIRESLASADPSNPNSTPVLLRGMKWLLACISKGRNVSDFYPHVVKLVGAPSLEVRKMVYMYLVQYADHDATTRELSLLSINSFQRGLADSEQLIRALALRVLSSIRVSDVLQIQILGVQKCSKDKSPYVRKCAANALAKLTLRCDTAQKELLLEIMANLLQEDTSTMVLTSTIIAFCELCPDRLHLLHSSFRKICHLLTDMDEWGQVVVIDTMARYCRKFFRKPRTVGSAEAIDRARRVRRTVSGVCASEQDVGAALDALVDKDASTTANGMPNRRVATPRKIKRRVVKKGFYSDEEDESTDEEVYEENGIATSVTLAGALRDESLVGGIGGGVNGSVNVMEANEDDQLHEDHRLLLRSTLPLLKSRNSGVVLAVCSLHYYCGVASVKVRSALGKALVRIHRDRREIQYVVLTSIRTLVSECPSAFTPFLNDFFVTAMDPSYTRMIKLDILTSLALEPASIEAVLKELRSYIRHDDKTFVCASIRAVGQVVELARIVYDRHGEKTGDVSRARSEADRIGLNCLYGLMALTQATDNNVVVGECIMVMQRISVQLLSDSGRISSGTVNDPNHVQDLALKRILLLLARSLVSRIEEDDNIASDADDDEEKVVSDLDALTVSLPPTALASALWIVGEWFTSLSVSPVIVSKMDSTTKSKMRLEIIRLVAKSFPKLNPCEKVEGIHLASKLLVSAATGANSSPDEAGISENVLSMGRVDVNTDVRDRARCESAIVHLALGLKHDTEAMFSSLPSVGRMLTVDNAKLILLRSKPPSSSLPLEDENEGDESTEVNGPFRFGSLSSLVSHRAGKAYLPLPDWAEKDSSASLRDPPSPTATHADEVDYGWKVGREATNGGFYDSGDESDSSSSSSDSSSSDSDDSSSGEESTSSSSGDSSSSSDDSDSDSGDEMVSPLRQILPSPPKQSMPILNGTGPAIPAPARANALVDTPSSDDSSSSESDETDDSDSSSSDDEDTPAVEASLLQMPTATSVAKPTSHTNGGSSSIMEGFEGLVMAPVVVDTEEKADPDLEKDSGAWIEVVRHQLGGGLKVSVRYLRGPTREREAKLIGLDPESVTTVCLQVKFENKRTDAGILRRVRIIQRSSSHGSIGTRQVVTPQEIVALKKGQLSTATLGISFQSVSDREGALQARFDIKSDRGSTPVDIRPSLGDMLQPCRMNTSDFDSNIKALQGFSRVPSTFQLPDRPIAQAYKDLPLSIMKHAALTPVDRELAWKDGKLRLVGTLPSSMDKVYVVVECDKSTGAGVLTVCCEHPLACNSLKDVLKSAVTATTVS